MQVVWLAQVHIGAQHRIQTPIGQLDFAMNGRHNTIAVVDFALIQPDGFDAVLVCPGVQCFFIDLTRLVDLQFGRGHFFHNGKPDITHGENIRGGQIAKNILVNVLFGIAKIMLIVLYILRHINIKRCPVVFIGI